jgi:hypothetical protein
MLDWDSISCNPNITMEIIEKYPNKPWDFLLDINETKHYYGIY